MELHELKEMNLVRDLIAAGMRPSIIRGLTGVGTRCLRSWWWTIHRERPPNGKIADTILSYIRSRRQAARFSAYVSFYKRIYGIQTLTGESILHSWREFTVLNGKLDINACYFAIRDVKVQIVVISQCRRCGAEYLFDVSTPFTDRCPFCEYEP